MHDLDLPTFSMRALQIRWRRNSPGRDGVILAGQGELDGRGRIPAGVRGIDRLRVGLEQARAADGGPGVVRVRAVHLRLHIIVNARI